MIPVIVWDNLEELGGVSLAYMHFAIEWFRVKEIEGLYRCVSLGKGPLCISTECFFMGICLRVLSRGIILTLSFSFLLT